MNKREIERERGRLCEDMRERKGRRDGKKG